MSDFTFDCPSCHQPISASTEHIGMQVDCPLCHQPITIPPDKIETVPGQAVAGLNPKLKMQIGAAEHKPTTFAPSLLDRPVKKKSKINPEAIGWTLALIALAVAGYIFGPKYYHQYQQKKADEAAAKALADNPPPPPPEPSAAEIITKMGDKYKTMTTFAADGKTTATLDMSELAPNNPAMKSVNLTATTAIRLARPDLYRLEWDLQAGQATIKGSTWSAGKGNFVATGPYPAKTRDRQAALSQAAGSSGTLGMMLAELFFNDKESAASDASIFSKTNAQSLNGLDCYVLAGEENAMKIELWIDKKNYLIDQAEVFLDGKLADNLYKSATNAAVKAEIMRASQIRGAITETYQNLTVDKPLAAADFDKPILPAK